jgi:hypothetical protein
MRSLFALLILVAMMITECDSNKSKLTSQSLNANWDSLKIVSEDNTVIIINNLNDSTFVKSYSSGSIFVDKPVKVKVDTLKTYFTMSEKDTLFNIIKDIVSTPPKPKQTCTDFVGDLKLVVYYSNSYNQSVEYSGVCDWGSLSDKTTELHKILKRKIKWMQN